MMKEIYIDSDSILYRASYLAGGTDKDLQEAMELATGAGTYVIATQVGGIPERPDITFENEMSLEANSEKEALKLYNDTFDNEYWVGVVRQFFSSDEEDIQLATKDELDSMHEMIKIFNSMVSEIVIEVKADAEAKNYIVADTPILVLTVKKSLGICATLDDNFRYEVMESVEDPAVKGYKANRRGMEVPEGLNAIYEYVYNLENSICIGGVEADDVVVHYGRQGHIVCALDKDVLGSLEYAYNFDKKVWIEHTKEEIFKFPYFQTITGDTSDGLRGVYRVGKVGANKALEGLTTHEEMWRVVMLQYALKEQTREEAIATMRCVLMNQWTPENGLVYWQPPVKKEK